MKLTTKENITNEQWKQQAERFSSIADAVNSLTFPKKDVNEMQATIEMEVVQPLSLGFKGRVIYTQQFEKLIETQREIFDVEGNPTGEYETIETAIIKKHVVVDYYETIPRDMANIMFSQFLGSVPDTITDYLDIQDWCIEQAFIQQVVSRNTFGGLLATDYTLTK
jgi:hypothetical protein